MSRPARGPRRGINGKANVASGRPADGSVHITLMEAES